MRESQAGWNGCGLISIASIMASHCRSSIGRRLATTTFDIFRSTRMDGNGLIGKVEEFTRSLILCDRCLNGATRSLPMRSRFDLARVAPRESMSPMGHSRRFKREVAMTASPQ